MNSRMKNKNYTLFQLERHWFLGITDELWEKTVLIMNVGYTANT